MACVQDREKTLSRQEHLQQLGRLNEELENMSRRNKSLQETLSAADCQNSVLELNLRQRNMEVNQLQDMMG